MVWIFGFTPLPHGSNEQSRCFVTKRFKSKFALKRYLVWRLS